MLLIFESFDMFVISGFFIKFFYLKFAANLASQTDLKIVPNSKHFLKINFIFSTNLSAKANKKETRKKCTLSISNNRMKMLFLYKIATVLLQHIHTK